MSTLNPVKVYAGSIRMIWNIHNLPTGLETEIISPIYSKCVEGVAFTCYFCFQSAEHGSSGIKPIRESTNFILKVFGNPEEITCTMSGTVEMPGWGYVVPIESSNQSLEGSVKWPHDCFLHFLKNATMSVKVNLEVRKVRKDAVGSNLQLQLGGLLESANYSDVTFDLGDNSIAAHKAILAARSPVFEAMFRSNLQENEQGRVIIGDIDARTFKTLLRFIYTGQIEDPDGTAFDLLLSAADKYGLDDLKAHCEVQLCEGLAVETVPKLLVLADLHHAEQLKKSAVAFAQGHPDLLETKDWFIMESQYPKLAIEVLRQLVDNGNILFHNTY